MFERRLTDFVVEGTTHEVSQVSHELQRQQTLVTCEHWGGSTGRHSSLHIRELAQGMTFEQAEEWLLTLPEYAEVETEQSLVERMRALLTPEQLAALGLGE